MSAEQRKNRARGKGRLRLKTEKQGRMMTEEKSGKNRGKERGFGVRIGGAEREAEGGEVLERKNTALERRRVATGKRKGRKI